MDEAEARKVLDDVITNDGISLSGLGWSTWYPQHETISLDGEFSLRDLQAIVWWMEHNSIGLQKL